MAEALAWTATTSFVEGLIKSNLTALASREVGLLLGVRGEISYIIEELEMMRPLLRSVEEKQETDLIVRVWVQRLKEVSLDIEDCMDKFIIHLKRRPNRRLGDRCCRICSEDSLPDDLLEERIYSGRRKYLVHLSNFIDWLGYRIHSLCTLPVRREIAAEIQDLKNRIVHISECRLRYSIAATSDFAHPRMVCCAIVDHRINALFTPKAQQVSIDTATIDNLLMLSQQQRRVITVYGMGGLGKTTLAKNIYDSPQVAGGFFICHAWIAVSQTFNLSLLLVDIIKQVSSPGQEKIKELRKMQNVELFRELRNLLQEKRYIIVLDDIWNLHAWESIKNALPDNSKGSRVIVTTRIKDVAKNCCASDFDCIHNLQHFSLAQSMELFNKRVFGPGKDCPEHLKKVANDIVVKCGGLPLAIVAIAGVLASKPNLDNHQQWSNFVNNLPSALEINPSLEGMKQVLLLSYNDLPYLLKPCFLYLSIFPEDHLIKRKPLIKLLVAEGLVTNNYDLSAEDVAEYYLNELAGRSLILPSAMDRDGNVKSCRIHDIMLDVLVSKSREENMVSILGRQSRTTLGVENAIRRLSLQAESTLITCIPEDVDLSRVRSLYIYDCKEFPAFRPRLRLLRVLVFENHKFKCREETSSFLRILSKLRHLRYLSLKGTFIPTVHPSFSKSLSKLRNLQTLDIRDTWCFPSVAKLRQLCHLLMGSHGRIYRILKPGELRNIRGLQTLVGFCINNEKTAEELECLTQLKRLVMTVITWKCFGSLCDSLDKLSGSDPLLSLSLTIDCYPSSFEKLKLDNSINPTSLLQSLKLRDFVTKLAKLTLQIDVVIDWEVIKMLPNLLFFCLTSLNIESPEQILFSSGGFGNLKKLRICYMDNLKSIKFQKEAMPVLQKLVITECSSVTSVIGIRFLQSLQEIQLDSVPTDFWEAVKSDADMHKNKPKFTAYS